MTTTWELSKEAWATLKTPLKVSELERLKEFTAIESSTLMKVGVEELQSKVAKILSGLGFKVAREKGDPRFASLVVGEKRGRSSKFITLVTHSDTVLANEVPFKVDFEMGRALGSGVIDNKGGLVVGLSALERFLNYAKDTHYSLRFICSPNEEMGSIGFTERFRSYAENTFVGLGLEPALDNGSIVHQRRGNRWYHVEVKGHEAHAGRSYGHDANAAHDLARKISELVKLTDYAKDISLNVGHFEGGKDRYNIVCGFASAKLDTRFGDLKSRDKLHAKIEKILKRVRAESVDGKLKTSTEWKITDDCPPFSLSKNAAKLAKTYAQIVGELEGRKIKSEPAGGAGDVNYLSRKGNLILDGLGPVGGKMHTTAEFLSVNTLVTRSQALAAMLINLQKLKAGT